MSIYNIADWVSGTTYNLNDIVKYDGKFYYSLKNSHSAQTPAIGSIYWGGVTTHNGIVKTQFLWKPSYNHTVNMQPSIRSIRFGDGYEQRIPDGIHTTLLKLDLIFDLRNAAESTAINHFLEKRKGAESFVFTPSSPFDLSKLFVCKTWSSTYGFYDNFSIRAEFEEVPS